MLEPATAARRSHTGAVTGTVDLHTLRLAIKTARKRWHLVAVRLVRADPRRWRRGWLVHDRSREWSSDLDALLADLRALDEVRWPLRDFADVGTLVADLGAQLARLETYLDEYEGARYGRPDRNPRNARRRPLSVLPAATLLPEPLARRCGAESAPIRLGPVANRFVLVSGALNSARLGGQWPARAGRRPRCAAGSAPSRSGRLFPPAEGAGAGDARGSSGLRRRQP